MGKVRNVGGDHRWYNNLFVGQGSLGNWGKNDLTLPVWYDGNVFAQGAHTTDRDKTGLVDTTAIDLKFEEREDGWYLTLDVPASWTEGIRRPAVTSDLLGTAIIPQQRFTNPDGSPIKITNDLIGRKRKMSSPYPGPLEIAKPGLQTIKVWGK